MSADSENDRLPFEPNRKRKKGKAETTPPATSKSAQPVAETSQRASSAAKPIARSSKKSAKKYSREETSIPEVVSRRMLRRMVFFSGVPVTVGILVFFASYVAIVQGIAELPNVVVLMVTLACFGLSVVGLSYGALSASWEEAEEAGSMVGLSEFQVNFERLVGAWRQTREERQNNS
ncbi:MAG: PAM68 family protein [Cyanobacteria bacterium J06626_4]